MYEREEGKNAKRNFLKKGNRKDTIEKKKKKMMQEQRDEREREKEFYKNSEKRKNIKTDFYSLIYLVMGG